MLTVLKNSSVDATIFTLGEYNNHLQQCWFCHTTFHERFDYPLISFLRDLIHVIAYTDEQGAPDGNWLEFANEYELTQADYDTVLAAMKANGYVKTLRNW